MSFVLRCASKKKIREREKSCQSPHGGRALEEMGQPSSQWRQRQLLQSYTTEKSKFSPKIKDIGSISSS